MKRLALLLASVASCVLFTACPDNKPTDNAPVVIPDGTYRETCECVYSFLTYKGDTVDGNLITGVPFYDTVTIIQGEFIYNHCDDTTGTLFYNAAYYCKTGRVPVYLSDDGYAHFDSVSIYGFPFDFNYQVPVYCYQDGYRFEEVLKWDQYHPGGDFFLERAHKFIHILTPIH